MERLRADGFEPVIPPVLVREQALYGTGFLPDTEQQIYRLADDRALPNFTGISASYESPTEPDLLLDTNRLSPELAANELADYVFRNYALTTEQQRAAG